MSEPKEMEDKFTTKIVRVPIEIMRDAKFDVASFVFERMMERARNTFDVSTNEELFAMGATDFEFAGFWRMPPEAVAEYGRRKGKA